MEVAKLISMSTTEVSERGYIVETFLEEGDVD